MNKYEKFFGTKERAIQTLSNLSFDVSKTFDQSDDAFYQHFLPGGQLSVSKANNLKKWIEWADQDEDYQDYKE